MRRAMNPEASSKLHRLIGREARRLGVGPSELLATLLLDVLKLQFVTAIAAGPHALPAGRTEMLVQDAADILDSRERFLGHRGVEQWAS